jgi:hypothetical protein
MKMMKSTLLPCVIAAVLGLIAGCVTDPARVSVPAVGPLAGTPPGNLSPGKGTLVLFTQAEPYNDGKAPSTLKALGSIYTPSGKLVERFPNVPITPESPAREFNLPAGEYLVSVPTPGYGQVTVPVVIVAGQQTPLHLTRLGMRNNDALPEIDLSRLPDGRIVGRRAYPPPPPPAKVEKADKPKA